MIPNIYKPNSNFTYSKQTKQIMKRSDNDTLDTFQRILEAYMRPQKTIGVVADGKAYVITIVGECIPLIEYARYG